MYSVIIAWFILIVIFLFIEASLSFSFIYKIHPIFFPNQTFIDVNIVGTENEITSLEKWKERLFPCFI